MKTAQTALQKTLPLVYVILIAGFFHAALLYATSFALLSLADVAFNYLILLVLFVPGQVSAWQKRNKNEALKSYVLSGLFRLAMAALFLIVSTLNSTAPFYKALHFIIPFLVFSVLAFQQIRSKFNSG